MVERITSGVPGLDGLIQNGLPRGCVTLITGGTGTGKTLFSTQFLLAGLQRDEPGVYVTLEEEPDEIKGDAAEFDWDLAQYEEKGLLKIEYLNPLEGRGFETRISDLIDRIGAQRVAIDSTSVMGMYSDSIAKIRERLYSLVRTLRKANVTAVVTSEIPQESKEALSRYGVEEFVCDGVIIMHHLSIGEGIYRNVEVRKMRRTGHEKGTYPMDISDGGLHVYGSEDEF